MKSARDVNFAGLVFGAIGLIFVGFTISFVWQEKIGAATATFSFSILSFIFALLARFKRFKGLGFEAELWEDKQKEAAALIDRLKDVVAIYSSEIVMAKVMANRFSDGQRWKNIIPLFDRLVQQHDVLGQEIDFSDLKQEMDSVMLMDCCYWTTQDIDQALSTGKSKARDLATREYQNDNDLSRYNARIAELEFSTRVENQIEQSRAGTLATTKLKMIADARSRLKREFDTDVDLDEALIDRLRRLETLYRNRPVKITPEILGWADNDPA